MALVPRGSSLRLWWNYGSAFALRLYDALGLGRFGFRYPSVPFPWPDGYFSCERDASAAPLPVHMKLDETAGLLDTLHVGLKWVQGSRFRVRALASSQRSNAQLLLGVQKSGVEERARQDLVLLGACRMPHPQHLCRVFWPTSRQGHKAEITRVAAFRARSLLQRARHLEAKARKAATE